MRDSRFRTWAAGDCYIAYPGYSSIRLERLIEGIQDYEKIRILRKEFTDGNKTSKLRKLAATLNNFKADDVWTRNITADLNAARATLNGF
jgi:hypothetical protein